jgi:NADH dehydrogenase [ubiquinone] 1 alpha subcomplex assembly factor 5
MQNIEPPPEIFDRRRRIALRYRAASRCSHQMFMWDHLAKDIAERLAVVSREFEDVLIIGPLVEYADILLAERDCRITKNRPRGADDNHVEEDRIPFALGSFDLVISAGTLDSVNDLPGALVQIRRCLRPDGLFLGHMFGAGTLSALRRIMMQADGDRVTPHFHPQIDLRSAADLLTRTGFALPVADHDIMPVRYSAWQRLASDLRDMGTGNALAGQRPYLGRRYLSHLQRTWDAQAQPDGKVDEQFVHIFLSGWAPSPDQPKAARRGSGKVSLAAVLPQSKP